MSEREWLGHRDWCPRQWGESTCDCPCDDVACPGISRCKDPDCPLPRYLADAEDGETNEEGTNEGDA